MKTKIDIISGFLGSGKTTFIQNMIQAQPPDEKLAIIENEFGKINIDGTVLKKEGVYLYEITAGCICCCMSGDFASSVKKIMNEFKPDRIIIEPTGVALLSEIVHSLKDQELRSAIEVDRIITLIDVPQFKRSMFISKNFIDNQLKEANTVVLNKLEGVDERLIEEVKKYVKLINPKVCILRFTDTDKNNARLKFTLVRETDSVNPMKDFESIEFVTNKRVRMASLVQLFNQSSLSEGIGTIIRAKGIIQTDKEKYIKFDFVMSDLTIEDYPVQEIGKVCMIGLNLNKSKIIEMLA